MGVSGSPACPVALRTQLTPALTVTHWGLRRSHAHRPARRESRFLHESSRPCSESSTTCAFRFGTCGSTTCTGRSARSRPMVTSADHSIAGGRSRPRVGGKAAKLVEPRVRPRDRCEPTREPLRRLRHDVRLVEPAATSTDHRLRKGMVTPAVVRAFKLDRVGLGRRLGRRHEGLHALLCQRALARSARRTGPPHAHRLRLRPRPSPSEPVPRRSRRTLSCSSSPGSSGPDELRKTVPLLLVSGARPGSRGAVPRQRAPWRFPARARPVSAGDRSGSPRVSIAIRPSSSSSRRETSRPGSRSRRRARTPTRRTNPSYARAASPLAGDRVLVGLGILAALAAVAWVADTRTGWGSLDRGREASRPWSASPARRRWIAEKPVAIYCDEVARLRRRRAARGRRRRGGRRSRVHDPEDLPRPLPACVRGRGAGEPDGPCDRRPRARGMASPRRRRRGDDGVLRTCSPGVELGRRLGLSEGRRGS